MKIAILGYGKQGKSAYTYWATPENDITIHDSKPIQAPPGAKTKIGDDYLYGLEQYDLLVRTPALHPNSIAEVNNDHPEIMSKVTTVTNEFFRVCPAPIIGVTGTKGKGTTSTLITKLLEAAGNRVHLGGNIGIPPLDLLANKIQRTDWVVLELANFQSIDLQYSPHIGVCLMVAPEHLDWHENMYEYVQAKERLFKKQTIKNFAVYNSRNTYSEEIADSSQAKKLSYEVPPIGEMPLETNGAYVKDESIYMGGYKICSVKDVKLLGRHNLENVCAAIAATWTIIGNQPDIYKNVFKAFTGLPHRIEPVGEFNKIKFINDSFASNPGATVAAINALKGGLVLMLGGYERNVPMDELAQEIVKNHKKVKKILLYGQSKDRLAIILKGRGYQNFVVTKSDKLPEIVQEAIKLAEKHDTVLFSPAYPSFDMFNNFEERGDQFKQIVGQLK